MNVDNLSVDEENDQLKHVLTDPAVKICPHFSKKYIKKSNNANIGGYDNQCYKSRKEYHKAKNKYSRKKITVTYTAMIEKSRNYKRELQRVRNKANSYILHQLRENKNKGPKSILEDSKQSQNREK